MKNAEIILLPGTAEAKLLKVVLKGDLTIKNADKIRTQILGNIKDINTLEIQTEEVSSIDLAFYQLLISLKKLFSQSKKTIVFSLIIPEEFEDLLKNAGLDINLN
jgi:anti-anti-sigma regulatory factor